MIFYSDAQLFEHKKEAFIAVVDEEGTVIFFGSVGYTTSHKAEGLALIQALRHIEAYERTGAVIYTDNLSWAETINDRKTISGGERYKETRRILKVIYELKEKWNVAIKWKKRTYNKAGLFLGKVWRLKEEERNTYFMPFTHLPESDADVLELKSPLSKRWLERRIFFNKIHGRLSRELGLSLEAVMYIRSAHIGERQTKEQIVQGCERFIRKTEKEIKSLNEALDRFIDNADKLAIVQRQKIGLLTKIQVRNGVAIFVTNCSTAEWEKLNVRTELDT